MESKRHSSTLSSTAKDWLSTTGASSSFFSPFGEPSTKGTAESEIGQKTTQTVETIDKHLKHFEEKNKETVDLAVKEIERLTNDSVEAAIKQKKEVEAIETRVKALEKTTGDFHGNMIAVIALFSIASSFITAELKFLQGTQTSGEAITVSLLLIGGMIGFMALIMLFLDVFRIRKITLSDGIKFIIYSVILWGCYSVINFAIERTIPQVQAAPSIAEVVIEEKDAPSTIKETPPLQQVE